MRGRNLRADTKCLLDLTYQIKEVSMSPTSPNIQLIAALPSMNISAGYPGSTGVIGRRCFLLDEDEVVVGEGIIGWAA